MWRLVRYINLSNKPKLAINKLFNVHGSEIFQFGRQLVELNVCCQGSARDVGDWWAIVRNWQWKHIRLKVEEEEEAATLEQLKDSRVFRGFQEVGVLKDTQRGNHMDMAEFLKYLQQHNVEWVFNELFGIDRS